MFDFGPYGEQTVSTPTTIELPAKTIRAKCREYDLNAPRGWTERSIDLRTDERTITCMVGIGPTLR